MGLLLLAFLALLAQPLIAPAGEPAPFEATSHRRFDDIEQWRKVFDDPDRVTWQKPELVVNLLALRPGMVVADVGAGTGYFERHLAGAVGSGGTVLAIEVEPNLVAHLRKRAEEEGTPNVVPILGSLDNPRLPHDVIDLVLFVDTFHHIDGRREYFRALANRLPDHARVVIIDWKKIELPVGPELDHKIDRSQVVDEMEAAGYHLVDESQELPYQYFLTFGQGVP